MQPEISTNGVPKTTVGDDAWKKMAALAGNWSNMLD